MRENRMTMSGVFLGIINIIATLFYMAGLPDIVPTHFNAEWVCDRMGSKYLALLTAGLPLVCTVIAPLVRKYGKQAEQNRRVTMLILYLLAGLFTAEHWFVLNSMGSGVRLGEHFDNPMTWFLLMGYGVLMIVLGNFMPTVRKNTMVGFRIKWTLESEDCWRVTHRFAGRFMVVSGVIFLVMMALLMKSGVSELAGFILLMEYVVLIVAVPSVYAYQHRETER